MTNLGLQVNYVHKRGEDYGAWQDIAGQYVQVPYIDNVGHRRDRPDRHGLPAAVESGRPRVPADEPGRDVHALQRRHVRAHQAHVAELAGRVVAGVVEGGRPARRRARRFTPTTTQSSQAGTFGRDAAGPNDFVNTDGRLIGDRPVVAKAQLIYRFPWGILASGNMQHQTGRFYSRAGARERPRASRRRRRSTWSRTRATGASRHQPDRSARAEGRSRFREPGEFRRVPRRAEPDQQRSGRVASARSLGTATTAFGVADDATSRRAG